MWWYLTLRGVTSVWVEAQDASAVKCSSFPGLASLGSVSLQAAHSGCFPLKPCPVQATACAALPVSLLPARLQHRVSECLLCLRDPSCSVQMWTGKVGKRKCKIVQV